MADQTNAAPAGIPTALRWPICRGGGPRLIRSRPAAVPGGPSLDSLAIGAPLTAAFIGVLLAEAGAVGAIRRAPRTA